MALLPQPPRGATIDEMDKIELARWFTAIWTTVNNVINTAGVTAMYATQYDDVGGNISYLGEALPGSLTSAPVWRIRKLNMASSDLVITWADGNDNFDNIWDNRLSLTYS